VLASKATGAAVVPCTPPHASFCHQQSPHRLLEKLTQMRDVKDETTKQQGTPKRERETRGQREEKQTSKLNTIINFIFNFFLSIFFFLNLFC